MIAIVSNEIHTYSCFRQLWCVRQLYNVSPLSCTIQSHACELIWGLYLVVTFWLEVRMWVHVCYLSIWLCKDVQDGTQSLPQWGLAPADPQHCIVNRWIDLPVWKDHWNNRKHQQDEVHCTLNCEDCRCDGVVAGPRRGGPAEVDACMLGGHICDDQVPVAQHPGVVDVDGLAVRPAPGDDGPRVASRHTLQNHRLVEGDGDVLRSCDNLGPLTRHRACDLSKKVKFLECECH